jgi:hypothetical protein
MFRNLVRQNIPSFSIVLFLIFYILIIALKPHFIYNKDGSLRNFGVGYTRKTVIPVWLLAIFLAITAYFIVLYFVSAKIF